MLYTLQTFRSLDGGLTTIETESLANLLVGNCVAILIVLVFYFNPSLCKTTVND